MTFICNFNNKIFISVESCILLFGAPFIAVTEVDRISVNHDNGRAYSQFTSLSNVR